MTLCARLPPGRALAEQQKVAELLGSPGMAAISALDADLMCWALGMARSRAFDATPGTFVMAPVLDMVNHAWQVLADGSCPAGRGCAAP